VNPQDLTIYIATHNRGAYLEETLESLRAQTLQGFRWIVGDNASTDDTPARLEKWAQRGVRICRSETLLAPWRNIRRGADLAETPWVVLFHDDDLLHPRFVEQVARVLSADPEAALVSAGFRSTPAPSPSDWTALAGIAKPCPDRASFATALYRGYAPHFGATVYRTDVARRVEGRVEEFGKICDYPFILENLTADRHAILLPEAWVQYRIHPGQDIQGRASGPFLGEVLALHRYYRGLMGTSLFKGSGLVWLLWNDQRLEHLLSAVGLSYRQSRREALRAGATTRLSMAFGVAKRLFARVRHGRRFHA